MLDLPEEELSKIFNGIWDSNPEATIKNMRKPLTDTLSAPLKIYEVKNQLGLRPLTPTDLGIVMDHYLRWVSAFFNNLPPAKLAKS